MSEWKEYRLGDICSRLSSGKNLKADKIFEHGLYPVYGGNGLRGYTSQSNFKGSCAIIGRQGAYCGNVRYFEGEGFMTEHAVVAQGKDFVNDYYLAVLLSTMHLERLSGQSAQPGLAVGTLSVQQVVIPPLPTQRRIAAILSSLDAKIENNNKVNAKLEEIAQNLFKEWFVDFGPFKDGKFVDSELGPIPEGWRVGTLGEIAEVIKNSINPAKHGDTLFAHYSLPAFDRAKMPELQYGDEIKSNKLVVKNDTILLSKLNPYIKRIWYVDVAEDNPICSTEFLPFRSKDGKDSAFIYSCITDETFYSKIMGGVTGATNSHQRLDVGLILDTQIVFNKNAFERFSEKVQPMLDSICSNIRENQKLATLRDTLLPKLMSGEIEV